MTPRDVQEAAMKRQRCLLWGLAAVMLSVALPDVGHATDPRRGMAEALGNVDAS
jgi:hypothetical protein